MDQFKLLRQDDCHCTVHCSLKT